MTTDRKTVTVVESDTTRGEWNRHGDRADVPARFVRRHDAGMRLMEIARLDRRAESVIYPLLGACGLFGIATHFFSAVPDAHQMEMTLRECLRLAGLC